MKRCPPWAESFQSHVITDDHVRGLSPARVCFDHDLQRLSFELWGHLNMCLHCEEKIAFNNVEPGKVFDACRRVVVPIGPRSEVHKLRGGVMKLLRDLELSLECHESLIMGKSQALKNYANAVKAWQRSIISQDFTADARLVSAIDIVVEKRKAFITLVQDPRLCV